MSQVENLFLVVLNIPNLNFELEPQPSPARRWKIPDRGS
jgi:hypothetical protein